MLVSSLDFFRYGIDHENGVSMLIEGGHFRALEALGR